MRNNLTKKLTGANGGRTGEDRADSDTTKVEGAFKTVGSRRVNDCIGLDRDPTKPL